MSVTALPVTTAAAVATHPLYQLWRPTWVTLLDVYEGGGGFLDEAKPYLWAHPREWLDHTIQDPDTKERRVNPSPRNPSPKLLMRRKMARYENVAQTVIEAYRGALFREAPQRAFGGRKANPAIEAWWDDADGYGHSLTDVMRSAWTPAAVFGSAICVMDRAGAEEAQTLADTAPPVLRIYSPIDMPDWLTDGRGELTAVKLLEPEPRTSLDAPALQTRYRVRLLTADTWTLRRDNGDVLAARGEHGFGRLPVVPLYARRRALIPVIGQSLLHDPALYIDLYNQISEVRELLRNQTFGILNIPLGPNGDVETALRMMGDAGTQNVLFSGLPGGYLSPSANNVRVYHEAMDRLMRTVYRLTALPWESDSRDAESAESRSLKRMDLHQVLTSFADELEATELALLELAYRARFGADGWQREWDRDQPYVAYPHEFDVTSLEEAIAACEATISLDLGEHAVKAAKKRAARRLVPGLSPAQLSDVDAEIDAQTVETADERQARELEMAMARFSGRREPDEGEDEDDAPDPEPEPEADPEPVPKGAAA